MAKVDGEEFDRLRFQRAGCVPSIEILHDEISSAENLERVRFAIRDHQLAGQDIAQAREEMFVDRQRRVGTNVVPRRHQFHHAVPHGDRAA